MKQRKSFLSLSILFLLSLLFCACGSESTNIEGTEENPTYQDSVGVIVAQDSAAIEMPPQLDTASFTLDTVSIIPSDVHPSVKSATLGYTYPPKLSKGEIGDINVQVEIQNPNSTLSTQLVKVLTSQSIGQNPKGDSIVIYSESIPFYKELDISLSDDAKDFEISPKHLNNIQAIDSLNGNTWHWTVLPITDKKTAQLMLKVVAKNANGTSKVFEPKRIFIAIKVDNTTGVRKMVNYLWENPKVSIPILISFFGFIGFLIKRKLEKKS